MRTYSSFSAIPGSFYSSDLYRDVAANWRGIGMLYLLLLSLLTALLNGLAVDLRLKSWANSEEVQAGIDKIPRMTIEDGTLSTDVEQPYRIDFGENLSLVIDTTGEITGPQDTNANVMLLRESFVWRDPNDQSIEQRPWPAEWNTTVNAEIVRGWLGTFIAALMVLAPLYLFVVTLVYRLVLAAIVALIALAVANSKGLLIGFGPLLRVAIVCMTPLMVISTLVASVQVPALGWAWFVASLLVLVVLPIWAYSHAFAVAEPADYEDSGDFQ